MVPGMVRIWPCGMRTARWGIRWGMPPCICCIVSLGGIRGWPAPGLKKKPITNALIIDKTIQVRRIVRVLFLLIRLAFLLVLKL